MEIILLMVLIKLHLFQHPILMDPLCRHLIRSKVVGMRILLIPINWNQPHQLLRRHQFTIVTLIPEAELSTLYPEQERPALVQLHPRAPPLFWRLLCPPPEQCLKMSLRLGR